jgi:hypothetical protein
MVSVLALSAVDCVFDPVRSNQRLQNSFCCFSVKHAALRRKSKETRQSKTNDSVTDIFVTASEIVDIIQILDLKKRPVLTKLAIKCSK